jgi:hypothetical protein
MSDFVEQLRLAEKAAEDIYFAKVSRELIESLHKRMQEENGSYLPGSEERTEAVGVSSSPVQTASPVVSATEEK